jgi:tyrosine-protein phosphatase YwqE
LGFLNNIFKKKEILSPFDLSALKVDVHSHFIPGIDDGAPTVEDSVNLITAMSNFGYKKVITTPHIMSDYYKNTPSIILSGLEKVKEALEKAGIDIEVEAAAEYNLEPEFEEIIKAKNVLSFGGDEKYVLFELSFFNEPSRLKEIIWDLSNDGFQPVLAHVERYAYWHKNWDKIEDMVNRNVKLQLNIGSITGAYGPEVRNMAIKLIDAGLIDFIGSDCHNPRHLDMLNYALTDPYFHKLCKQPQLLNHTL